MLKLVFRFELFKTTFNETKGLYINCITRSGKKIQLLLEDDITESMSYYRFGFCWRFVFRFIDFYE